MSKQLLERGYQELSRGNTQPLLDSLAEDVQWTIIGSTKLSGVYHGKREVTDNLLARLRARLAHVHSDDTVGTQDTAWNLAYGREIGALDVLGYTANDFQITDEAWSDAVARCRAAASDGDFVCFPGVEWCGTAGVGGDHNVVWTLQSKTRYGRSR